MLVLIWATLLFSVRGNNAVTGESVEEITSCFNGFCITLSEGEITAEAGLCVVIPCSFTTANDFTPQHMVWFKCEPSKSRCGDADVIFHTNKNNNKVQSEFLGRVSLLEPEVKQKNCSIIINNLTESDSGSYQLRVNGLKSGEKDGFTFSSRATVSVKGLTQKPSVLVPPLTEGQQTTLTCTAPGLCSGSDPEITWTWRGAGNITAATHSSTLTFNPSAEHHGTNVTCKVSFSNNISTEETVTLNVAYDPSLHSLAPPLLRFPSINRSLNQNGARAELPWVIVAVVSLIVNVICIILLMFLWNTRKKVKPNQEDRTYASLRKTDLSAEYDVIAQPLN